MVIVVCYCYWMDKYNSLVSNELGWLDVYIFFICLNGGYLFLIKIL